MLPPRMKRPAAENALPFGGIAAACLLTLVFAGATRPEKVHLAIRGVAVVDVETGRIVPNQTILVEDDRIATIGWAADVEIPSSAQVVDGEGLFALPGLADLHVHLEADDLTLFLANGITTVREMNGSPEILELRTAVRAGGRTGPTIYVAGPLLAGVKQPWRHRLLRNADEARTEVVAEREAGFDFVKVYEGLSAETYRAIIETASELGMPVVGHIPEDVGLEWVISHEQRSIEHIEQIVHATVGHDLDRTRIPDIVRRIRGGASAVTPTLAAMEILSTRRSAWFDGLFTRPEMRYTPPGVRGWWDSMRQPKGARADLRDSVVGGTCEWIEFYRELTAALAKAGIPILVGTDTPNPLLVPGYSLHHELEALVRAGLEPARVLRAVTHDAAVFLDAGQEFGVLQAGFRADILLVAGNPLENLSALRQVHGLVLRGDWITRESLDESLKAVARRREP